MKITIYGLSVFDLLRICCDNNKLYSLSDLILGLFNILKGMLIKGIGNFTAPLMLPGMDSALYEYN